MRRHFLVLISFFGFLGFINLAHAQGTPITRAEAFMLIWQPLHRAITDVRELQFSDVPESDPHARVLRHAKARGILDGDSSFYPSDPLELGDALLWLFRSRNIADVNDLTRQALTGSLVRYPVAYVKDAAALSQTLTEDQLMTLMRQLDESLATEIHEASLYGEDFHGQGTAFGETFDMNLLTAAHRTLPHNTLVKVTNIANGKSVIARINDRGPYVKGRDIDLSVAAFTAIADRSLGKINVTLQRIGDATIIGPCVQPSTRQQRITRTTILNPGIPHILHLGDRVTISSSKAFVMRSVRYPDELTTRLENWILPRETYSFKPSVEGDYIFNLSSVNGQRRQMEMHVVDCTPNF